MTEPTVRGDDLGDRMKGYEDAWRFVLPKRLPVIVRVDGKAFHSLTASMEKPFDSQIIAAMDAVALELCREIQGARLAYIQSDEVSVLLHNYATLKTEAWFGNLLQKIVSVSASIAGVAASRALGRVAIFDSRVFLLPEAEVTNYFLWRQQDATRNSIQMLARSLYSHKELMGKKTPELQELCFRAGQNWNDLATSLKRGRCAVRETLLVDSIERHTWKIDNEIPIWTSEGRVYIEKLLEIPDAD